MRIASLLLLSACTVNLKVANNVRIACETDADCVSGGTCAFNVCLSQEDASAATPILSKVIATPAVLMRGTTLRVSFASDQPLFDSQLKIRFGDTTRDLSADSTYTALGDEPEGLATIIAVVVGRNGIGNEIAIATVRFDFTPPQLDELALLAPYDAGAPVTLDATPSYAGTTEADATLVSVELIDATDQVIANVVGFSQLTRGGAAASFAATIPIAAFLSGSAELRLRVVLSDAAGNTNAPGTLSPTLMIDASAPSSEMTGPSGSTAATTATFVFACTDAGATFACSLDGSAFTPCTSPRTFEELAVGDHTFAVRATDAVGNQQTQPTTITWSIIRLWRSASVGAMHACAITSDDRLYCWGEGRYGKLGNIDSGDAALPVQVTQPSVRWQKVAAGTDHTCALSKGGSLVCWGHQGNQLGHPGLGYVPVAVGAPSGWVDVAAGNQSYGIHVEADGSRALYSWGTGTNGELGLGVGVDASEPTRVGSDGDWVEVVAGVGSGARHACARKSNGKIYCFGANDYGQLGVAGASLGTPQQVSGDYKSLGVGTAFTCAVRSDDKLSCWGSPPRLAGDPISALPSVLGADSDWQSVSAGNAVLCATKQSGALHCWGLNAVGQLGRGTTFQAADDIGAPVLAEVESAAVSGLYDDAGTGCALTRQGALSCWGNNSVGQVGRGVFPVIESLIPHLVGTGFVKVGAPTDHVCAIKTDGGMYCWGPTFEHPDGGYKATPTRVGSASDWLEVASANGSTCGIRDNAGNRSLFCMGTGGLGDNSLAAHNDFVPSGLTGSVTGPGKHDKWAQITAAPGGYCGIRDDLGTRTLNCWGNSYDAGVAGISGANPLAPEQISAFTDWSEVDCGGGHCCALRNGGAMYCWGTAFDGGLGDGIAATHTIGAPSGPQTGFSDWRSVMAGGASSYGVTCGIRNDDSLYCFGRISNEQHLLPLLVGNAVATASVGDYSVCAVTTNGTASCFGQDAYGSNGWGGVSSATLTPIIAPPATWESLNMAARVNCGISAQTLYCMGTWSGIFGEGGLLSPSPASVAIP